MVNVPSMFDAVTEVAPIEWKVVGYSINILPSAGIAVPGVKVITEEDVAPVNSLLLVYEFIM